MLSKLEDKLYVAAQLQHGHFQHLKEMGVTTIINNRPDGERGVYIGDAEMKALAEQHGMDYHFVPVNPMALTMDAVQAFAKAVDGSKGAAVAYCASGRRSATMWALVRAGQLSADEIISTSASQGHDLSQMRPLLMQMAAAA